jgi:hypothetical protein
VGSGGGRWVDGRGRGRVPSARLGSGHDGSGIGAHLCISTAHLFEREMGGRRGCWTGRGVGWGTAPGSLPLCLDGDRHGCKMGELWVQVSQSMDIPSRRTVPDGVSLFITVGTEW